MNLSDRIIIARNFAKLTQAQLAEKSGVTQQAISRLEKGLQKQTTEIVSIAIACKVRPEWLACEQGEMTGGLYIVGERIKRGVMMLEQMQADDRLDDALDLLDTIAKFSNKASNKN